MDVTNGPVKFRLKLFVTGQTPKSEKTISDLKRICEDELGGSYELQIIDTLLQPELAEKEKVLATPTLIKELPPPLRRLIGSLSDKERVLAAIGLDRI